MKKLLAAVAAAVTTLAICAPAAMAEEAAAVAAKASSGSVSFFTIVAIVVAAGMTLAAIGAAFAQGNAVKSAVEGIARNPGASGNILTTMLVGLAMIESLAIYVLVIALILLFANPFIKYVVG